MRTALRRRRDDGWVCGREEGTNGLWESEREGPRLAGTVKSGCRPSRTEGEDNGLHMKRGGGRKRTSGREREEEEEEQRSAAFE